jgi:hypothetical protein
MVAAEATAAAKRAAVETLKAFEWRVVQYGRELEPCWSNRIDSYADACKGMETLRQWSTANHPSYGSPNYRSVSAVRLADGRIGYRYIDTYYDMPQDYVAVVPEFFADEPEGGNV